MTNERITSFIEKLRIMSDHNEDMSKNTSLTSDARGRREGKATAYANAARWLEQELKEGRSDIPTR